MVEVALVVIRRQVTIKLRVKVRVKRNIYVKYI